MLLPVDKDSGMKTWYDKVINLQLGFSGNANAATTGSECHKLVRL